MLRRLAKDGTVPAGGASVSLNHLNWMRGAKDGTRTNGGKAEDRQPYVSGVGLTAACDPRGWPLEEKSPATRIIIRKAKWLNSSCFP
jgi:hypothetical protein